MNWLKNKLSLLKNTRYLDAKLELPCLFDIKLLENGKCLRQLIETQYYKELNLTNTESEEPPASDLSELKLSQENLQEINPRLRFVYTNEFRNELQLLRRDAKKHSNPYIVKTASNNELNLDEESMPMKFLYNNAESCKLLITDRFFHRDTGLEKLYKIQRQRKIWWMRFSADPSRYYLESFELANRKTITNRNIGNAQSISIKSRLPIGDIVVEHITLVPLNEVSLHPEKDFEIYDLRNKKNQIPAVIRSVINLDVAACALIFDGVTNNKREDCLFLNRKLAPYQCLVAGLRKDSFSNDLNDLCIHISNVIRRAGLRTLNMDEYVHSSLDSQLNLADKLGIPYIILASPNSLTSGLLELRNRDTTLNETIHISDVPGYLLNIFHAN